VSIGVNFCFDTDSGSTRASICSVAVCSCEPAPCFLELDAGSFIKEAGVAGLAGLRCACSSRGWGVMVGTGMAGSDITGIGVVVALDTPPVWAGMYGDLLVDLRAGTGGGGMSVKFSGETDASSSDVSTDVAEIGSIVLSERPLARSSTSLRTWDTIAGLGPAFRRCGFEMGELFTLGLLRDLAALFFLAFLERSTAGGGGTTEDSSSMSMGELLEWVLGSYADAASFWGCSAGDVKGLK
jgi:hypothetical protein